MKKELTETNKFMIEKINEKKKNEEEKLKKANDSEKFKIRLRIKQLNEQLEKAKTPFERTPEEVERINKMIDNVKENVEVQAGNKIEGDRSDKQMSSKDEFQYGITMFINEVKKRREHLLKTIPVQEGILELLENHEPVGDEKEYAEEIKSRKNIVSQAKMALELFDDRIKNEQEVITWALENYENISKLNRFLNNPLGLKDYIEYEDSIKAKYLKGDK